MAETEGLPPENEQLEEDPLSKDNTDVSDDPFSPENIQILQFIMLSRIYDVLMIDLNAKNPTAANELLKLHGAGHIAGHPPMMSGRFIAPEDNTQDEIDE